MTIRPLRQKDIPVCAQMVTTNFTKKYTQASIDEMEAMFYNKGPRPKFFVATERGQVIGMAAYTISWMDYSMCEIIWLNVEPTHQRRGIGTALTEALIRQIKKKKEIKAILLSTTKPLFYKKRFGFKILSKFPNDHYDLMMLRLL